VRDITIIASAQAVEHHEIALYGTLCAWAKVLQFDDDIPLLQTTLEEEKNINYILTLVSKAANAESDALPA
jgi:ferritin-like metal-binding protein YciE